MCEDVRMQWSSPRPRMGMSYPSADRTILPGHVPLHTGRMGTCRYQTMCSLQLLASWLPIRPSPQVSGCVSLLAGASVTGMPLVHWPAISTNLFAETYALLRLCIAVMAGFAEREEWTVEEGCCLAVLVNVVADGGWGYVSALVAPCAEWVGC